MPDNKKSAAPKNSDRRMKPQGSRGTKTSDRARATTPAAQGAVAVAQPLDAQKQLSSFESAMKLFHAKKWKEARELFLIASEGPERDVAQRSRLHAAMCDRRLERVVPTLSTAEDYYNYGVALINTRDIAGARAHLEKALQMSPGADHVHFALALAQALSGDTHGAYENLKRAIELEPRNRLIARQDPDFAPLTNQPPFDALVFPEKRGW